MLSGLTLSVIVALLVTVTMIGLATYILFWHDANHEKFENWVDFSFTAESLARAFDYYRFMAVSMLFTYVAFTISTVWLQVDGFRLFTESGQPTRASPISVALFTLDLVLRGGFFDFMQHFDMSLSHIYMDRSTRGYVWYAFVFRMFYALTMFKILFSFLWILLKVRLNWQARRRAKGEERGQLEMF